MANAEPAPPSRGRRMLAVASIGATALAADLLTKQWAFDTLRRSRPVRPIRGVLHFEFAFNTGAAFGVLDEAPWSRWLFVTITVAALVWVGLLAWRWTDRHGRALAISVGLLMGGALGNLYDRLFRELPIFGGTVRHGVVDFIVLFYWPKKRWPAFNIADVAVLVGMAGLLWVIWRARKDAEAS